MITEKASDRRASVRRPIRLAAKLEVDGADHRWPCQLADFCAEGLFLRYSVATSREIAPYFAAGSPQVRVIFREADDRQSHVLHAQPVRRIEGAMGVEFADTNPGAITALLQLCGDEKKPHAAAPVTGGHRPEFILRQCTRETARFVEPMMTDWFQAVEKALRDAAQHAASDQQANDYMDAAVKIRARRRPSWHLMSQVMESPLHSSTDTSGKVQLGLVDKGEFEDWLLLRVMVTKAETLFRGPLLQLKMRLDKAGFLLDSGHQNPLGPILVCDAFRQAQEHLDCSRAVDKIAFRTFDKEVVRNLEKLYLSLNDILIRQGILPDLDLSKYLTERNPVAERARKEAAPTPKQSDPAPQPLAKETVSRGKPAWEARDAARNAADREGVRSETALHQSLGNAQSAFATVARLLATLKQVIPAETAGPAPTEDRSAAPLSLGELQQYLGDTGTANLDEGDVAASLRDRVLSRVAALEGRKLDPEQQATVDVVDQFFSSLERSPRLNEISRGQLQQLGMPVLRAVLQERRYFEEADSPVRGVLNRIAQLGVRGSRHNPVLQRKIDGLVERISQGFDTDGKVFRTALAELDELVARQNLAYRRNVERVTAAAEGSQKVEVAKQAVTQALDSRLAGQKVPRALVSLLNGGWRDLLALTYVRQGPGSSLWQDYLAVLDSLMAFSQDPEMAINLPELLHIIQEGLATVSSNQIPPAQIRDELKRFLIRHGTEASELIEMPTVAEDRRQDLSSLNESRQKALQRWLSRAQGLQVGDWLKFQENPELPSYMRLVWIGSGFSRFVFVNHQGMKVVELELLRLASHLQKGILVSDPDYTRPIVDESIDRMIQQVYEQTSRASVCDELTGVLTRREFERSLGQWLAACAARDAANRPEQKVLAVLELQQFRELSDSAGFNPGDEALRQVANLLRSLAPSETACLARLSGARFGLLLDAESAEAQAAQIAERIQGLPLSFAGRVYSLSVNVGLAIDQPGLATAEHWLAAAEEVLVNCRRDGLRGLVWYAAEPVEITEQFRIANKVAAIRDLDQERVLLRCHKIIPLHGTTLTGTQHQVLFSVYDDYGQLIHSAEFMRMAEHQDRVQAVGRWMVGHMLEWLATNPKALENLGAVGLSLSGRSLSDASLLEFIFDRMSQKDAPIERLWFEIAEAAATDNLEYAAGFMNEMRELGCRFCLSSFSGRSESYATLKRLPVDRIKLDSTFISALPGSESDQAMVRSMTDMAHFLGREVVAPQVESVEILDLMRTLGVDYAQGHAIENPRPLES